MRLAVKKLKKIFVISIIFFIVIVIVVFAFVCRFSAHKPQIISENLEQATTTPYEIAHGDRTKKQVIFTFDGGAGVQSGNQILKVLAKHHVKGTFFLTGKMVETDPDLVKRIVASGSETFNHTFDHPDLTTVSDAKIGNELAQMEKVLQTVAGVSSKPYFRPPFGAYDARVLKVAAGQGYQLVFWTIDAFDWKESKGETAGQVRKRILSTLAPGNIYLMHVGDDITGVILDDVFTAIESRGYKIVSLTQGL